MLNSSNGTAELG